MKKILALLLIVLNIFTLSSCFLFGRVTTHPDMIEYSEEEILSVAKDKYSVINYVFTGVWMCGRTSIDENGRFSVKEYGGKFGTEFHGGDNITTALTAFAGKNGNHDVQGQYSIFLCYVALAECSDSTYKFIYYNTNLHKDAIISDTIGASDYIFDVLPCEITNELFTAPSNWGNMKRYLSQYHDLNPRDFIYSGERLAFEMSDGYGGTSFMEFYKENGKIVFDLLNDRYEYDDKDRRVVYSTSDRYGVIYYSGASGVSEHFDVFQTLAPSTEEDGVLVLRASVTAKPIDGTVLYSNIRYRAEYPVLVNGVITIHESHDSVTDELSFEKGYGMEIIDGVDYDTAPNFTVTNYFIFYEKS